MLPDVIRCGDPTYTTVQFEWFLTNWCNYQCSYCSEAVNMVGEFSKQTSAGKYKLALARLKNITSPFQVELIGGEPTLHPKIEQILESLDSIDACKNIEVVTNLSRSTNFYKNINLSKVSFLASYHPEYHREEFVGKLLSLGPKARVTVNLTDRAEHWPKTIDLIDRFDRLGIRYSFNLLEPTSTCSIEYSETFFKLFEDYIKKSATNDQISYTFDDGVTKIFNQIEISHNNLNKFKNYSCTPIRYRITHDGDIYNLCTNRKLPMSITSTSLYQKERCPNTCCSCDAMYVFYKEQA
jgi:sulfatase maturation enzyme AslB (radical SAM superfamily)